MNAQHNQQNQGSSSGRGVNHDDPSFGGPWQYPFADSWGLVPGWGGGGPRHHPGAGHPHRGAGYSRWGRPRRSDGPVPDRAAEPAQADDEKPDGSDHTVDDSNHVPDPAEVTPGEDEPDSSPWGSGRRAGRCGRSRRRGCGGHGPRAGYFDGPQQHPFASGPPPNWPTLHGMIHGLVNPLIRDFHDQARRYAADAFDSDGADASNARDSFTPPVDVFDTKTSYVVHVALPGALKQDLGVAWDPDSARLRVAGVVHRPGDELFLAALASGERRVGLFERHIALPLAGAAARDGGDGGDRDLVDADNISAKMENGILVIVVPKLEKDWTQIRRVDIE